MPARLFNLSLGSLYRTPLRLMEELQGVEKRSWDLGYHHAIRHPERPDDKGADDKEAYARGFASGRKEQPHPTKNTWTGVGRRGGYLYDKPHIRLPLPKITRDAAVRALRSKGINMGEMLGAGAFGEVYRTDQPGKVVKLDLSGSEHRLAKHILNTPELAQLRSLPKVFDVIDTGVIDKKNGTKIHAIHREDLHDLQAGDETGKVSSALQDGLAQYGQALNDVATMVRREGLGRQDALQELDQIHKDGRESFFNYSDHQSMFDRVHRDVRKLVSSGVVPCDMQKDNWGHRSNEDGSTDVVMRDVGCFSIARESGPYQLDSLRDAHQSDPSNRGALSNYLDVLHTSYPDVVRDVNVSDGRTAEGTGHHPVYFMRPNPGSIGPYLSRSEETSSFLRRISHAVDPDTEIDHNPENPQTPMTIRLGGSRSDAHTLRGLIKHHYPGSRPKLRSDESGHRIELDNIGKLRSRGERLYRTHRQRPSR